MKRCGWVPLDKELYVKYHDEQWGVPVHEDRLLFEMLCLEGAQAGLSWYTVLRKRENYITAFNNFDAELIAKYDQKKIDKLLSNPGIIRNKLKVNAFIKNAKAFLSIKEEFGSFDKYIWSFTNHKTIINNWETIKELPATSEISDKMSKDLKRRGFSFVGSTICYSFMQACGMVNDHTTDCFRYNQVRSEYDLI